MKNDILRNLEEESIEIIRNTYLNSHNPIILYSIGKDSSVLLHLFLKAFFPLKMPIPLLHIDTGWKFKSMIKFRDTVVKKNNLSLIVHQNKKALKEGINPFDNIEYTTIMKTNALKEVLSKNKYDFIYGGARRDEEKSRSKEKILSHRNKFHVWDPKNQRIEPWHIFNTLKENDESFRIFPLSNWTELNIWQYIHQESIEIVPLYFSKKRKVVKRNNNYFLLDDNRFKFEKNDIVAEKNIRFRTLGCYPLTSGIESSAKTTRQIINEITKTNFTERSGRLIDFDEEGSMELKKRAGYF